MSDVKIEAIEYLDYEPKTLKSGVVYWTRQRVEPSGVLEVEACVYASPEREFWYRFYERVGEQIPRLEIWHYGDVSPFKCLTSASREFPEFEDLDRAEWCAMAGVFSQGEINLGELKEMSSESRLLLVRRARRWASQIDWI